MNILLWWILLDLFEEKTLYCLVVSVVSRLLCYTENRQEKIQFYTHDMFMLDKCTEIDDFIQRMDYIGGENSISK